MMDFSISSDPFYGDADQESQNEGPGRTRRAQSKTSAVYPPQLVDDTTVTLPIRVPRWEATACRGKSKSRAPTI